MSGPNVQTAKGWVIGDFRTISTKDRNGNSVTLKKLQLRPGVKITVDGREVDLGEYNSILLDDAIENTNFKLEKGYITPEQHSDLLSNIENKGISYIVKAKFKG